MVLPAILAALGTLVATYRLALLLLRQTGAALISVVILMTSVLFAGAGQIVRMDMVLVLCITWALFFFYRSAVRSSPATLDIVLFFALAGCGTLAKGPIALGLPVLIGIMFLGWHRTLTLLNDRRVIGGMVVYLAIVGAWIGPAVAREGWEYIRMLFIEQNVSRLVHAPAHAARWYFYLYTVPWAALPWFPFLVSMAADQYRHRRNDTGCLITEPEARRFLWTWLVTTFLLFSIASGKLSLYVLPLFPPLAILLGGYWAGVLSPSRAEQGGSFRPAAVATYALAGLLSLVPLAQLLDARLNRFQLLGYGALVVAGLLCVAAARQHRRLLFGILVSIVPLVIIYTHCAIIPVMNASCTVRTLSATNISELPAARGRFCTWRYRQPYLRFYAPGHIEFISTGEEAERFFATPVPGYCLVKAKCLSELQRTVHMPLSVVAECDVTGIPFVVVSQVPDRALSAERR